MHWVRIQWKCYAFLNMVNQSKISTSIPSFHYVRIGFCYLKANGIARSASCIDSAQRFTRNLGQPRYICPSTRLSPRLETSASRDTTGPTEIQLYVNAALAMALLSSVTVYHSFIPPTKRGFRHDHSTQEHFNCRRCMSIGDGSLWLDMDYIAMCSQIHSHIHSHMQIAIYIYIHSYSYVHIAIYITIYSNA